MCWPCAVCRVDWRAGMKDRATTALDPELDGEHDYSQADIDAAVIAAKWALHDLEALREALAKQLALVLDGETHQ